MKKGNRRVSLITFTDPSILSEYAAMIEARASGLGVEEIREIFNKSFSSLYLALNKYHPKVGERKLTITIESELDSDKAKKDQLYWDQVILENSCYKK